MKTMEAYVKKWYDFMDSGRIMGMRCKNCGAFEFPPVPVCNACCSTDVEWVEMSGKGTIVSLSADIIVDPVYAEYGQQAVGLVQLAEGPTFISWLEGVGVDQIDSLFEKLPIPVKMIIQKREKYSFPVFKIAD